jgi:hypothetical protein
MSEEKKVYIVARGLHSWDSAAQYGELVFLSESPFGRTAVSNMVRAFAPRLKDSKPTDYIVVTGLSVMCSLACVLFAIKHMRLNLLLFDAATEKYIKRTVMLDNLEQVEQELDEAIRYPA